AVLLVGGAASAVAYADHRDASRGQTVQAAPSGGTRVAALGIAAVLPAGWTNVPTGTDDFAAFVADQSAKDPRVPRQLSAAKALLGQNKLAVLAIRLDPGSSSPSLTNVNILVSEDRPTDADVLTSGVEAELTRLGATQVTVQRCVFGSSE